MRDKGNPSRCFVSVSPQILEKTIKREKHQGNNPNHNKIKSSRTVQKRGRRIEEYLHEIVVHAESLNPWCKVNQTDICLFARAVWEF